MTTFTLPVGYHELHKTKIIDYQLNRWHSMGYVRLAYMQEAGRNIKTLDDWKDEMVRLAKKALTAGHLMDGTFLYRAAEFFTHPDDPDKMRLYDKFQDLFYNELFPNEPFERHTVPYQDTYLPALLLPQYEGQNRGTVVVYGGFDSFMEELYSMAKHFHNQGYEVILFEGPGQGAALKKYGVTLHYRWEEPAKAVLDYFDRDDVTWMGVSMGGWTCFRAAAFEKRIKRVIALSIAYDYMEIPPKFVADFARWLMKRPKLMNRMSDWKMRAMPQENWGVLNLMHIADKDTPYEASLVMLEFNKENIKSELVTQDVLILSGTEDHFIPLKLHHLQVAALTNARSVTERIFGREEQAQNHCQIGNLGLALNTMSEWLVKMEKEPAAA